MNAQKLFARWTRRLPLLALAFLCVGCDEPTSAGEGWRYRATATLFAPSSGARVVVTTDESPFMNYAEAVTSPRLFEPADPDVDSPAFARIRARESWLGFVAGRVAEIRADVARRAILAPDPLTLFADEGLCLLDAQAEISFGVVAVSRTTGTGAPIPPCPSTSSGARLAIAPVTVPSPGLERLDLGTVNVGAVASQPLFLTNVGTAPLRLRSLGVDIGRPVFSDVRAGDTDCVGAVIEPVGSPLPPGEMHVHGCQVDIRVEPMARGAVRGSLRVDSNDETQEVRRVELLVAAAAGRLAVAPDRICLAEGRPIGAEMARGVTITNAGPGDVNVTGVRLSPPGLLRISGPTSGRLHSSDRLAFDVIGPISDASRPTLRVFSGSNVVALLSVRVAGPAASCP